VLLHVLQRAVSECEAETNVSTVTRMTGRQAILGCVDSVCVCREILLKGGMGKKL
jgi:hypothetical protein